MRKDIAGVVVEMQTWCAIHKAVDWDWNLTMSESD